VFLSRRRAAQNYFDIEANSDHLPGHLPKKPCVRFRPKTMPVTSSAKPNAAYPIIESSFPVDVNLPRYRTARLRRFRNAGSERQSIDFDQREHGSGQQADAENHERGIDTSHVYIQVCHDSSPFQE
jgi:hypothetical protein